MGALLRDYSTYMLYNHNDTVGTNDKVTWVTSTDHLHSWRWCVRHAWWPRGQGCQTPGEEVASWSQRNDTWKLCVCVCVCVCGDIMLFRALCAIRIWLQSCWELCCMLLFVLLQARALSRSEHDMGTLLWLQWKLLKEHPPPSLVDLWGVLHPWALFN